MSIRPWVVVEAPDGRGLRRVTVGGAAAGSAWSLRELHKLLDRLGYPDVDVEDPASVCWRGGDSGTWPDRSWRRRATGVLMVLGLAASAVLNAVIGWPDASGALTFAQRITGALFVLSGLVQVAAAISVFDYWGRRQSTISGAIVLFGVLTAFATDSLLLMIWLEEREYTRYMLAFMPLWCWSLWALFLLVREKTWKGVPQPRRFAAGIFLPALLTALSLVYSTMYQPAVAPIRFALDAEFGEARADRGQPFVQVPLKLSVKNTGEVSVYVIISDFTVYGRAAKYAEQGRPVKERWKESVGQGEDTMDRYADQLDYKQISSGLFYEPGEVLGRGQEDDLQYVFQIPANAPYDVLHVDLQITYMRQDRGRIDTADFSKRHPSWKKGTPYFCHPSVCHEALIFHGRVRYNNSLIDVTRRPRYVTAEWFPLERPKYSISPSSDFKTGKLAPVRGEPKREAGRVGIANAHTSSEVSLADLLKSIPSPSPS